MNNTHSTHSNKHKFVKHPEFQVVYGNKDGDLSSRLLSLKFFSKGDIVARLEGLSTAPEPTYRTLQFGPYEHVELNSDLVYLNHSCDPTVEIDVTACCVRAVKDIKPGDELTFFYPSTEYEMNQPFRCWCGSKQVLYLITVSFFSKH